MSGYKSFAHFYDRLTGNIDYKQRAEYFDKLITINGGKKEILLDLACGTGSLTEQLSKLGYDVIGVDASAEMLSIAASKGQQGITYLCQDMRSLDLYGTIDATICALDSINHITEEDEVMRVFERVSLFTVPGGLFIFDVNTIYKHEFVLGNNTFVYDLSDIYCVWQNEYLADTSTVKISLDIFECKGEHFYRHEESFYERAYSVEHLETMLKSTGFNVLSKYELGSLNEPKSDTDKIVFVARKD